MSDLKENRVLSISIEKELKNSYLDYAMSVIISRALPDVRDGLKPVHRRILFAMNKLKNFFNQPYKKSARIVGEVIGKYHPHGDTAVYDTIVRMAQSFSLRYPLIDGQGNFGSVDGDSAAAMRYTEIRLSKIAHEMLKDLDKNTVSFIPNYDSTNLIPSVLPSKIPNLLINGCSGIAVGMATNIPPHNFTEVINGCLAYIDNNNISIEKLMTYIHGPDLPTGGIIQNYQGLLEAYTKGKGKIFITSKYRTDIKDHRVRIIFYEIPYQINKAKLIERIAQLIKEKKIDGVNDLRDESDKDGLRIVIELKKDINHQNVLNTLYQFTDLQIPYYINMVALYLGQPKLMNLKKIISTFIDYQCDLYQNKILNDLSLAKKKLHILEGYLVVLPHIDKIITYIKNSKNITEAKNKLMSLSWKIIDFSQLLYKNNIINKLSKNSLYTLSSTQVEYILELKIYKLNNLEYSKIIQEYNRLIDKIIFFQKVLNNKNELIKLIQEELLELKQKFGDNRLTTIGKSDINLSKNKQSNIFLKKKVLITLSNKGYIKCIILSDYVPQHRGGKGKYINKIKEDSITSVLLTYTDQVILCFSSLGKVYWLQVSQIYLTHTYSKGKPINNFITLQDNEKITTILSINPLISPINRYLIMITAKGIIKKSSLIAFYKHRKNGILAINLIEQDKLIGVKIVNHNSDIMLFTAYGKAIRFKVESIRAIGRNAQGIIGIKLNSSDSVVSIIILDNEKEILTVTKNGYGNRTLSKDFPITTRGTKGVISIKITPRNGLVVRSIPVNNNDEVFVVTNSGRLLIMNVKEIRILKRNTKGVLIMKTNDKEKLVCVEKQVII